MEDILFWLFALVYTLLIPACMLFLGRSFQNHPPKTINGGYGYRTARSMSSQKAWDYAQVYSGQFWARAGGPMLAVSVVWMLLLFGRGVEEVGISSLILTGIQMIPFLAVIPATERALKRKFGGRGDNDG